ncbi:MAG: ATP-grasp domain-containing protein [Alphaproteobacteria bacterium]|nr:ATP-grasp domain-containing protein [Alphaproteobacteria bacterium]
MINSVLIANRGEIACRIIRTAHRLGIRTVVVYSDADVSSRAVEMADESYRIGPPSVQGSYLNIPNILDVAEMSNVQAIHPGYGFLSENNLFAKACSDAGFIFIGPSLEALKKMGSKREAKAIAHEAGIPVIPGYEGDPSCFFQEAEHLGYPLLIKAIMGGGGKGIRQVNSQETLQEALEACKREAFSSFGNEEILLEKKVFPARHIEVQIFGDKHGNLVHLFERDCSLQRRHQKVVEETTSSLPHSLKENLYQDALKLGRAIGYEGAGTVEFLIDRNENYYFMEMNTRLQVEHPVTEEITGIDLVEWQIRVASGDKLPLTQREIKARGHAIELRLYAEDPQNNFKPTTGKIWIKNIPDGTRVDSGLHTKDTITPYYDPMIAKLIVTGKSRLEAFQKAKSALEKWVLLGLKTNASFLKRLLNDRVVLNNELDVDYIDRHLRTLTSSLEVPEEVFVAASLIKVFSECHESFSPWEDHHNWHLEGYEPRTFEWICDGKLKTIFLTYSAEGWVYEPLGCLKAHLKKTTLYVFGQHIPFWVIEDSISLFYQGEAYTFHPHIPVLLKPHTGLRKSHLKAPLTGKVVHIFVKEGESIKEDQPLLILEAMKMEYPIVSQRKGKVKHIFFQVGEMVKEGQSVADVEELKEVSNELTKES